MSIRHKFFCQTNPEHVFDKATDDFWCPLCVMPKGMLELRVDEEPIPKILSHELDGDVKQLKMEIEYLKKQMQDKANLSDIPRHDDHSSATKEEDIENITKPQESASETIKDKIVPKIELINEPINEPKNESKSDTKKEQPFIDTESQAPQTQITVNYKAPWLLGGNIYYLFANDVLIHEFNLKESFAIKIPLQSQIRFLVKPKSKIADLLTPDFSKTCFFNYNQNYIINFHHNRWFFAMKQQQIE